MTDLRIDLIEQRRAFLGQGLGLAGLASALVDDGLLAAPQDARTGHSSPRAKQMIFLHMVGAPSQLDLFDNKPVLREHHGRECPAELLKGQRFAFLGKRPKLMGSPFAFRRHGESGLELSELLPGLGSVADEVALIKTVHTSEFNHGPAQVFAQTGFGQQGRPSLGSWLSYGLGSLSRDLPAYVVLVTGLTPGGGSSLWGNGFLPSVHQGVRFRTKGDPVLYASNPKGIDRSARGRIIDDVVRLNRLRLSRVGDPEIATRIANYELAFRMQTAVPGLMDLSQETRGTLESYGADPRKPSFANNCL
ncbi:MAG TPA: sulfatase, partial [Planctomycetaceae bacterium]|nr:sulfatase [Planctomycetaceae bacterium]